MKIFCRKGGGGLIVSLPFRRRCFCSPPRGGRPGVRLHRGGATGISTHAPVWGATPFCDKRLRWCRYFYSRPRIGGAHTGAARRRQKPACDSRERGIGSQSSTAEPVLSVGKRVPDDRGEGIRLKADLHAAGHLVQFHHGIVIPIAAGIRHRGLFCDLDQKNKNSDVSVPCGDGKRRHFRSAL